MTIVDGISLVVTGVVAIWGIYQTRITWQLKNQVEYLTRDLDQRIARLLRTRDLIRSVLAMYELHREALKRARDEPMSISADEFHRLRRNANVDTLELRALAHVINDEVLLANIPSEFETGQSGEDFDKLLDALRELIEDIPVTINKLTQALQRVYELMSETTQV